MSFIRTIPHKLRGSLFIARHLVGQRHVPYLPPSELAARRDRNLQATVRYAAETVPFYQGLFRSLGLDPSEIRSVADLARLPIVEKQQVQADPEQFVSSSVAGRTALVMPSSGTTGLPLQIHQSQEYILANTAYDARHRAIFTQALGLGTPHRQLRVAYPNNSGHRVRDYVRQHAYVPARLVGISRSVVSLFDPLETVIEAINRQQPNILTAYGTFIELLFKTMHARHIPMHIPKVVYYVSDHLAEETQQLIRQEYGVQLLSSYSAVEALRIGFTCPANSGFHLHSDLTHVRVVDEAGHDLPPGTTGDLLISNLTNRGTVLLNYRIGDRGQLSEAAPCACGRTLPRLARLEGRRDDVAALPNGQFLHSATVWAAIRSNPDFIQYQLIQHTLERFELKLAVIDTATFDRVSADLVTRLQPVLGPGTTLTTTYVSPFEPFGPHKRSQLVSYLNRQRQLNTE